MGSTGPRGKKNWSVRGRTGDRTRDLLYACVARRAAPARTQNRNHTSMLEPFYGFDHSAECPKAKIYRWRRKIFRPAHLWGEVFFTKR